MTKPQRKPSRGRTLAANKKIDEGHRFLQQGHIGKAEQAFGAAVRYRHDDPHTHINLAFPHLLRGDFETGFRELEWRLKIEPWASFIATLPRPHWRGEDLRGKTILLYTEQGAGDAVQCARFVPRMASLGATVVIATQPALKPVLESVPGVARVLVEGDSATFDYVAPLFSLPGLLNVTPGTIPAEIPYIAPPVSHGTPGLDAVSAQKPKVGIVWAGNPEHLNDKNRSIGLERFLPIVQGNPDLQFVSFQIPLSARDRSTLSAHDVLDLAPFIEDYADTVAYLDRMDLVITVDTSVAHVAGALGKEVWTLLPFAPDWRWMLGRVDSPWYPAMRLFRQPRPQDWHSVVGDVNAALRTHHSPP